MEVEGWLGIYQKRNCKGLCLVTFRYVFWCGKELDNVAVSNLGGMTSESARPVCPDLREGQGRRHRLKEVERWQDQAE